MVRKIGIKSKDIDLSSVEYTDADAVAAMGALGDANPLNHDRYTDAEAIAANAAAIAAVAVDWPHYLINPRAYSDSVGTWNINCNTSYYLHYFISNGASNDNGDYLEYTVTLPAGDYYCLFLYQKHSGGGIVDVYIDAAEETSVDTYAAAPAFAYESFNFTIAADGTHTIKFIIDGKNGSSTDHVAYVASILIGRYA